jgi:hypothetical protein
VHARNKCLPPVALNLRRGCVTRNEPLGLVFMSGTQLKTRPDRRERSPATIPWVINDHTANAIGILEALSPSAMLFPPGKWGGPEWLESARCRTTGSINADIGAFINWFNTEIADTIGHPTIGADEHGAITSSRLRRTLAWHIVRRPGGTVAGATQYGHLHTRLIHGYAGRADSGFLDEISFEEFLMRAEQLHDDHRRLQQGERVSGPAADTYRQRVNASGQFAGLTITTPAQANNALANPNLHIHHGALLTCVYRQATAACRADGEDGDGPLLAPLPTHLPEHRPHRPRHRRAAPPRHQPAHRPVHAWHPRSAATSHTRTPRRARAGHHRTPDHPATGRS